MNQEQDFFPNTGTTSEIVAMSIQDWYGHLDNKKTIELWLAENYARSEGHINLRNRINFVGSLLNKDCVEFPILELGGGASDMSAFLKSNAEYSDSRNFIISDISMSLIDRFFPIVSAYFNVESSNFPKITARGESIPIDSNKLGAVIAKSVVHHFEDFEKAGKEIHRVLAKSGVFIFINDPICKPKFGLRRRMTIKGSVEDLTLGFNCRSYYIKDYLSLGIHFKEVYIHVDPGFIDEVNSKLVPYWSEFSARTFLAKFLIRSAHGRTILSILLGIPLIFEYRK